MVGPAILPKRKSSCNHTFEHTLKCQYFSVHSSTKLLQISYNDSHTPIVTQNCKNKCPAPHLYYVLLTNEILHIRSFQLQVWIC
jgi:hypothetical protein